MKTATARLNVHPASGLTPQASSLVHAPHAYRLLQIGAIYVSR
jgi:hypothetical protein